MKNMRMRCPTMAKKINKMRKMKIGKRSLTRKRKLLGRSSGLWRRSMREESIRFWMKRQRRRLSKKAKNRQLWKWPESTMSQSTTFADGGKGATEDLELAEKWLTPRWKKDYWIGLKGNRVLSPGKQFRTKPENLEINKTSRQAKVGSKGSTKETNWIWTQRSKSLRAPTTEEDWKRRTKRKKFKRQEWKAKVKTKNGKRSPEDWICSGCLCTRPRTGFDIISYCCPFI